MSADNWAACLNCRKLALADIVAQEAALKDQYGKVSADEYQVMQIELADARRKFDRSEEPNSFREDYEIYGAESGTVVVSYSGHCVVCGFGLDFEVKREIPEPEGAK